MMNSFEMNRIASLSYNQKVCQEIFDLFESIINFPAEMTVLTLQKTLVLMKHLLLYGESMCVKCCWNMGRLLEELRTFNTALLNAKNQSFFHNLKGGSVDVGGPVRIAATEVHDLLSDTTGALSLKRMSCADPNSLVPIGCTQDVVFRAIESNIATKRNVRLNTKSNLKKSNDGFGSGYNPNSGKQSVVGAAHSLEEMLKTAAEVEEREMNKYYDDANDPRRRNVFASKVQPKEVQARHMNPVVNTAPHYQAATLPIQQTTQPPMDLLDFTSSAPTPIIPAAPAPDFFGGGNFSAAPAPMAPVADLLGGYSAPISAPAPAPALDLLGMNFDAPNPMHTAQFPSAVAPMNAAPINIMNARAPARNPTMVAAAPNFSIYSTTANNNAVNANDDSSSSGSSGSGSSSEEDVPIVQPKKSVMRSSTKKKSKKISGLFDSLSSKNKKEKPRIAEVGQISLSALAANHASNVMKDLSIGNVQGVIPGLMNQIPNSVPLDDDDDDAPPPMPSMPPPKPPPGGPSPTSHQPAPNFSIYSTNANNANDDDESSSGSSSSSSEEDVPIVRTTKKSVMRSSKSSKKSNKISGLFDSLSSKNKKEKPRIAEVGAISLSALAENHAKNVMKDLSIGNVQGVIPGLMNQIPNSVPLEDDDDAPPPMPSMPPPMPPGPSSPHQPHSLYDEPLYDMSAMGGGRAITPSLMDPPTSNGHDYDYGGHDEVNDDYPVMGMGGSVAAPMPPAPPPSPPSSLPPPPPGDTAAANAAANANNMQMMQMMMQQQQANQQGSGNMSQEEQMKMMQNMMTMMQNMMAKN
eukprot:CAMPEP_0194445672 /NCGR_PEP_ID=MMETSP0176-20130528/127997_1 /TAXON_ID=216777 /ORGANISM="Proboscia alata, Strain PI-D3" /LENGTH=803 /DNA_ID=CAMNT_0039272273 /DNA_START=180 /DNA_END=2591 /DNA_ORIENTATION=+